jgi:hypothetical protein
MITVKDMTKLGFAAMDAERRRDLTRVSGYGEATQKPIVSKSMFLVGDAGRMGGRNIAHGKRSFMASQTKGAAVKDAHAATHGHSRHK